MDEGILLPRREPKHIDPKLLQSRDYFDHIKAFNAAVQNQIRDDLGRIFTPDGFCIATTGSDGRLEKGPVSPLEVVLFLDSMGYKDMQESGPHREELSRTLMGYIRGEIGRPLFEQGLEIKSVDTDEVHKVVKTYPDGRKVTLVSPNRIFDSMLLYGNPAVLHKAQQKLVEELKRPEARVGILERIIHRAKEFRNVAISGIQKYGNSSLMHYNPKEGVAFYDPDNHLLSFKQGPLRAVQFAIVRDLIKELRAGKNPDYLFSLTHNTVDKLREAEVKRDTSLTSQEVIDLTDGYKYFMWLYHISQMAYLNNGEKETRFDVKEVQDRSKRIAEICVKPIIVVNDSYR